MKKGQIISLALGSAAVVAGAVFYTAAKIAGVKTPSKHDAHDELVNTPYKPEEEPDYEQEEFAEEQVGEQVEEEAPAEEIAEDTDEYADEYAAEYAENSPSDEEPSGAEEKEPENLEEYIEKNPEERANLNTVGESFSDEGVRTDISFVENTMFFDFVMTDVDDAETEEILKPDLEQFLNDQTDAYKGIVQQIEEDTGFKGIKMIVIFMDANEEEIVSGHYDSTGRVM